MLTTTQSNFIKLSLDQGILALGQFTLKSGRKSPYFFNAGQFYHGSTLQKLGSAYAETILANTTTFDHLFGPAYKGIPLATTTAIALAQKGKNVTVTFNRKEVKDHGEGGSLIGAPLLGNTIIIDDVITAGTAFYESKRLIEEQGGNVSAIVIALDRGERGMGKHSALKEIEALGVKVLPIVTIYDVLIYLEEHNMTEAYDEIRRYLDRYGSE